MDGLDIDSKFRLAILAAKRAHQLVNGAKKKVDMKAENPLTIAIEEINQGKINFHILEEDEVFVRKQEGLFEEPAEEDEIDILEDLRSMVGPSDDDDDDDEDEDDDEDGDDESDDHDDEVEVDDDHDYDEDRETDDEFDDED